MRRKLMFLMTCLLVGVGMAMAQTKVTGVVLSSEDNEPVVGASVLVKGTTTGTITDINGQFDLANIPNSAKALVISYIGMKTQEVAIKNTPMKIMLESDSKQIDEVVVVGYGMQRKKDLTSSISKVGGSELAELTAGSFDTQLAGRAAGVQVSTPNAALGTVPVYQIRGVSSMTSSTQPLIVIDGMPVVSGNMSETGSDNGVAYNSMADINPNDIESVEILKDGAATAVYGSRAANGVVLITTKKGTKGKAKFTYDGSITWSSATKRYDLCDATQFKEIQDILYGNQGKTSPAINDGTNTDWQDYVMRTAFQHNHNISASGGTEKSQYYMSLGYSNQEGIVRANSMERYNIKGALDQEVNRWLKVGLNVQASRNTINGQLNSENSLSSAIYAACQMLPNVSVYDSNNSTGYNVSGKSLGKGSNKDEIDNSIPNIIWVLDNNVYKNSNTRVLGGGYAEVKLLDGLTFKTQANVDYSMVEGYIYWNPDSGDGYSYGGLIDNSHAKYNSWNWQNVLNFYRTFNNVHNVSATAVQEYNYTSYEYTESEVTGLSDKFFSDHIISNTYEQQYVYGSKKYYGMASYLLRANYNYDSKYYIGASIRRDGLSRLSKDNRWGTFWGVSGAWRISRENFWKEDFLMNDLRFRASYAIVGNSDLGKNYFPYLGTYTSKAYGDQKGIAWNNMGNSNLKWESTGTFDIGIDGGLLNNRITFEAAYWQKDSKDLVMQITTASSMGIPYNYYYDNNGKVRNSGLEFTVGADIIRSKNFSWHADVNFSTQYNKVKELNNHTDVLADDYTIIREGESYRSLYGYEYYGVNQTNGNPIWVKGDGSLVQLDTFGSGDYVVYDPDNPSDMSQTSSLDPNSDRKVLGSVLPKWFGGITNTFKYRNWDATVFLRFSGGNKIMNATRQNTLLNTNFANQGTEILDCWKSTSEPGDGMMPKVGYGYGSMLFNQGYTDSHFVEKGDYLKLAQLAIGYTLPKSVTSRLDLTNIRFFLQAQNLFTITGYKGLDPESRSSNTERWGVDWNSMPQQRSFTLGASITF